MASCRASISWLHRGTYSFWWIGNFFLMLLKVIGIERREKEVRTEELQGGQRSHIMPYIIHYHIGVCQVR